MAAIAVAGLHALLGYALITAFGVQIPVRVSDGLKLFEIAPERPPPPAEKPVPHQTPSEKREGAASAPNLKAKPSQIVAPPPEIRLVVPPPIVASPAPGAGSDSSAGAADVPGPGMGSGGQGAGTGGGGSGEGEGDYTPPHRIRGRLRHSDYPRAAGDVGIGRRITVQFAVEPDGHVAGCTVIESSGNALLDDATCRAIERRYRYEPSRDENGMAVPSAVVEEHTWQRDER